MLVLAGSSFLKTRSANVLFFAMLITVVIIILYVAYCAIGSIAALLLGSCYGFATQAYCV